MFIFLKFFFFSCICVLFIQCQPNTQQRQSTEAPPPGGGAAAAQPADGANTNATEGDAVSPEAPPANNLQGFIPETGQLQYSRSDEADDSSSNSNDPLYKSSAIRSREGRWGSSAPMKSFDSEVLEDYRLGNPFNSRHIKNMRVYVDMEQAGSDRRYYSGKVTISYNDSQAKQIRFTRFYSGEGDNAKYNVWFRKNNKLVFHGFFQENEGSLILVVDRQTRVLRDPDAARTNPDNLRGGSVWIMMFKTTFSGATSCTNQGQDYVSVYNKNLPFGAEKLLTVNQLKHKCWFKTRGPYDCRTWRHGNTVNTFQAVEPNDRCYSKLGEFQGLDIPSAFNVRDFNNLVTQ